MDNQTQDFHQALGTDPQGSSYAGASAGKLSLQEELDVLEAVYKIGQEKGLDLLRPDQIKKLVDGGRMISSVGVDNLADEETIDKEIDSLTYIELVACEVLGGILDIFRDLIIEENGSDFWSKMSDKQKLMAINVRMYVTLGISIKMMKHRILSLLEK